VWRQREFNAGASAQVGGNRTTRPRSCFRLDGKNWDRAANVAVGAGVAAVVDILACDPFPGLIQPSA
jgi:hypothetical protein